MTYKEQRTALVAYLQMKVETEDWHAVADAAMDLREMEAGGGAKLQDASGAGVDDAQEITKVVVENSELWMRLNEMMNGMKP